MLGISGSIQAARIRARRRKSAWNLLLIPLWLVGFLSSWYGMFRIVWAFHQAIYPQHAFRDFWQDGIGFVSFVPSFLMVFGPFPGSLCIGFVFANCVAWLIPPARRKLDAEAASFPELGFRESNATLVKWGMWLVPCGLVLALLAASLLKSLR